MFVPWRIRNRIYKFHSLKNKLNKISAIHKLLFDYNIKDGAVVSTFMNLLPYY